jgi:hypothetical protein
LSLRDCDKIFSRPLARLGRRALSRLARETPPPTAPDGPLDQRGRTEQPISSDEDLEGGVGEVGGDDVGREVAQEERAASVRVFIDDAAVDVARRAGRSGRDPPAVGCPAPHVKASDGLRVEDASHRRRERDPHRLGDRVDGRDLNVCGLLYRFAKPAHSNLLPIRRDVLDSV